MKKTNTRLVVSRHPDPDPFPHLPVMAGIDQQGIGSWVTEEKYRLLLTYIDAARSAAKSKFSNWVFIDPFCGPGRIRQRGESFTRPGGSMVAWEQSKASGTPFSKILIGDISEESARANGARLRAVNAPVEVFVGPASETVIAMCRSVPKGSLCLAYLDPFNLAYLSFDMIRALASLPRIDFVVHFSTMDLMRNVDLELDPERARFDDVAPGWRGRAPSMSKQSLPTWLLRDWMQLVQGLGFEFSKEMHLVNNDSHREIYRLVFFAKNNLPIKLWGDIARPDTPDLFG